MDELNFLVYMSIAGTSVACIVDLPVQDSENVNSKAYKVYVSVFWKGPPPKKYSVLPSACGGRLDVPSEWKWNVADVVAAAFALVLKANASDMVLKAVHRPKRPQRSQEWIWAVDNTWKIWVLHILWLWFIYIKNSTKNYLFVVNNCGKHLYVEVYLFGIGWMNITWCGCFYILIALSCTWASKILFIYSEVLFGSQTMGIVVDVVMFECIMKWVNNLRLLGGNLMAVGDANVKGEWEKRQFQKFGNF
jgi:hypothetical protein